MSENVLVGFIERMAGRLREAGGEPAYVYVHPKRWAEICERAVQLPDRNGALLRVQVEPGTWVELEARALQSVPTDQAFVTPTPLDED